MAGTLFELNPVRTITTGFIGQPGKRVFYLQAHGETDTITVIVEKQQVEALAQGIEQFLTELREKFPDLPAASAEYSPADMSLTVPVDPAFRVGQLGLGYDQDRDMLVLVAQEIVTEGRPAEESHTARFFATRAQMRALGAYGLELVKQGRPKCGNCGQPIDPEGHFCPRSNGHKH
ncbi:MAG: DUF3090 family protein [Anaerolineales bacterium]|nr:DUF3090 family protein [Anaerolineales bacterium]